MQKMSATVGRFVIIAASALGLATAANGLHYSQYWQETVTQSHTVSINLLSHTAPAKLSLAVVQHNTDELQHVLNSSYGVFGMVMTDCTAVDWECPQQTILYSTAANENGWQGVDRAMLRYHPFDFLRNPPPVQTEAGYDRPQGKNWQWTGRRNPGRVIGRVYYVRTVPPSFWVDYRQWLDNPSSTRGAHPTYALTAALALVGGAVFWVGLEGFLYVDRRQLRQRLAEQRQTLRDREVWRSRHQLQTRIEQASQALTDQNQWLTKLQRYRDGEQSYLQHAPGERVYAGGGATLPPLDASHHQPSTLTATIQQLAQSTTALHQAIARDTQLLEAMQLPDRSQTDADLLQKTRQQTLTPFERQVLHVLEASASYRSGAWRILAQVDLSQTEYNQFVDFIVLTPHWAIDLLTHDTHGEIYPTGQVKQTRWRYRRVSDRTEGTIRSAEYKNPYLQVTHHATALKRLVHRKRWGLPMGAAIAVLSIIVFPDEAEISSIGSKIGESCYVVVLGSLIRLLEKLDDVETTPMDAGASPRRQPKRMSPAELQALIERLS